MQSPGGMRPLDELHAMAQRVVDEHRANSLVCEKRWCDELDLRRQELAAAAARLLKVG